MTPEEFINLLNKQKQEVLDYLDNKWSRIAGVEAKNHFEESFQNEGFTDETLELWKEVKRRENPARPDRAAASRKILTGETGDLGRSIEYEAGTREATITADTMRAGSDKNYAAAHNEGTINAGRNRNVIIPKRQFIGKSKALDKKIKDETERDLKKILE